MTEIWWTISLEPWALAFIHMGGPQAHGKLKTLVKSVS
jgi:hypothetical protein